MQNNQKTHFRIRPLTKYDYIPYVEPGKRDHILEIAMKTHPKLDCRGKFKTIKTKVELLNRILTKIPTI